MATQIAAASAINACQREAVRWMAIASAAAAGVGDGSKLAASMVTELRRVQGRSARARFVGQPYESRPAAKLLPQAVSAASGIREASLSGTAWNRPGARGCEASPLHPKAAAEWYLRKQATLSAVGHEVDRVADMGKTFKTKH